MTPDAIGLFTRKHASYERFIHFVRYPNGIHAFFLESSHLRNAHRILDAGCGTGVITLALRAALEQRGLSVTCLHAFDLTPAMLERFRAKLGRQGGSAIELAQADVMNLGTLPRGWTGYDLIVTSSMLEYVPRERLSEALANLRVRLSAGGSLIVFITKSNWLTKPLVGTWWQSNVYDEDEFSSAVRRAGFSHVEIAAFPAAAWHLSLWGHIVVARNAS